MAESNPPFDDQRAGRAHGAEVGRPPAPPKVNPPRPADAASSNGLRAADPAASSSAADSSPDPGGRARRDEILRQINELEAEETGNPAVTEELERLRAEVVQLREAARGTAWHRVELARHPQRPHFTDYLRLLFSDFSEIHGDRRYAEDAALMGGMARFHGREVLVIGHEPGRDIKEKLHRNFGMPKPEGYRKALRLMKFAEKFRRPILTFIDTKGAYPGIDAEERGQAEAIALNLREMAKLQVPVICTVLGEGGSGGALAIALGNRVLMLENATYSVISPEGCASIMWRDAQKKELAADALKITAPDLLDLGLIDEVVPEPIGGAHLDAAAAAATLDKILLRHLEELERLDPAGLRRDRFDRFRRMGQFFSE
jgi:acetyl-CoA carboxylase carboxyl transferase subunit alpha